MGIRVLGLLAFWIGAIIVSFAIVPGPAYGFLGEIGIWFILSMPWFSRQLLTPCSRRWFDLSSSAWTRSVAFGGIWFLANAIPLPVLYDVFLRSPVPSEVQYSLWALACSIYMGIMHRRAGVALALALWMAVYHLAVSTLIQSLLVGSGETISQIVFGTLTGGSVALVDALGVWLSRRPLSNMAAD